MSYQLEEGASIAREVEYVTSFEVSGSDERECAENVRLQLLRMKDVVAKSTAVILMISLSGIRVCLDSLGQNVFMVHALKRISYATCNPSLCQFSFLARNRRAPPGIQCCHVFFTSTPQEAVELNCIVADMFKTAYLCQRYKTHAVNGSAADQQRQQSKDGDVAQNRITMNSHALEICHNACAVAGRRCDCQVKLRPASAVSQSSSSDGASADVNCSLLGDGLGLGSVSSITESVNSWSFRYPDVVSSVASDDVAATADKSTLLVDPRCQQSQNKSSANVRRSCPSQNVRSEFFLIQANF